MKALILAAGYPTRPHPLTRDRPGSLLTIRGKPIVEHIINKLEPIVQIDEILIIANQRFLKQFQDWADGFPSIKPIKLISDGTTNGKDKLGAIGDIALTIREEKLEEDLLVIAGDNLFNFSLQGFIDFAHKRRAQNSIGIYNLDGRPKATPVKKQRFLKDSGTGRNKRFLKGAGPVRNKRFSNGAGKFGVVQINAEMEIVDFQEKPDSPRAPLVATCIYFFPGEKVHLISEYLSQNNNNDAPGYYISWLSKSDGVYGYTFEGDWRDIGDIDTYTEAVFTF